jgi:hypothetical protein
VARRGAEHDLAPDLANRDLAPVARRTSRLGFTARLFGSE